MNVSTDSMIIHLKTYPQRIKDSFNMPIYKPFHLDSHVVNILPHGSYAFFKFNFYFILKYS